MRLTAKEYGRFCNLTDVELIHSVKALCEILDTEPFGDRYKTLAGVVDQISDEINRRYFDK